MFFCSFCIVLRPLEFLGPLLIVSDIDFPFGHSHSSVMRCVILNRVCLLAYLSFICSLVFPARVNPYFSTLFLLSYVSCRPLPPHFHSFFSDHFCLVIISRRPKMSSPFFLVSFLPHITEFFFLDFKYLNTHDFDPGQSRSGVETPLPGKVSRFAGTQVFRSSLHLRF